MNVRICAGTELRLSPGLTGLINLVLPIFEFLRDIV